MTTDLMVREDPNDTGDIPRVDIGEKTVRIVGDRTQNLAPYVHGLAPALRRPTAALDLAGRGPHRIERNDEDFEVVTAPVPMPVPQPSPAPKPDALWEAEPAPKYVGRHRRRSFWGWLTTPLSAAVQIIRAAL